MKVQEGSEEVILSDQSPTKNENGDEKGDGNLDQQHKMLEKLNQ